MRAVLILVLAIPRRIEAALPAHCWMGSFANMSQYCCSGWPGGREECWDGEFTFSKCCVSQECKSLFLDDRLRFHRGSSRIDNDFTELDNTKLCLVEGLAGNAHICASAGGVLHSGLVSFEEQSFLSVAICMPPTCLTETEKMWVFDQLFGEATCRSWQSKRLRNIAGARVTLRMLRTIGEVVVSVAHSALLPLTGLVGIVFIASVLDNAGIHSIFAMAFSVNQSLKSLFAPSVNDNNMVLDMVRVLLTFLVVAGHVANQTEWRGQPHWLRCATPQPFHFWHCLLYRSFTWNNPGFVILSSFLVARSMPVRSVWASTCWALRRLTRSYLRQVAQHLGTGTFLAVLCAAMPYHSSLQLMYMFDFFQKTPRNWLVNGFLLGPFFPPEATFRIATIFETQLVIQVAVIVPLVAVTALPRPLNYAVAGAGIGCSWAAAVSPDYFHSPAELIVSGTLGFALGFIFPCYKQQWSTCVALIFWCCGVAITFVPIIEPLLQYNFLQLPGTTLYQSLKLTWALAPSVVFTVGFSTALVAVIQLNLSTALFQDAKVRWICRFMAVLSRLSLGILVNNLQLIEVVKAFGLGHERLPCTTFVFILWLIGILVTSSIAAIVQWCLLEAPTSALCRAFLT